ncbi:solute carrier family 23 protein [Paenibacillus sediminis]|uniref:NCS2 family nucleobase:cation symporter-2 n=1 Tax=Paenibacillus sediminis TaxID=664909 RepID=A0ABS4H2R3_9BACL|nr:solute carrier family 23 protein [Paenibacillus sediminis]MBP1936803.1 NCS2 family nucleobase:cation symporter-2 [Paenibacillus sediminis]
MNGEPQISIGIEDKLPFGKSLLFGLQHVFVSNVWLDPIFIAAMIGLPLTQSANIVNAIFIGAGLVTLVQATKLVRLPVVQGPSAAFDALMISTGKAGGLAAAGGGIVLSALIVFVMAITGILGRLKILFTPVVSGTVIFVVGIALSGFTLSEFLGGTPDSPGFASSTTLLMSIPTALTVIILSVFGKGRWKSYAFLIGLLVGDFIALLLGKINFGIVGEKSWFSIPQLFPYGKFEMNWATFLPFFIAYMAAVIEGMGVYQAAADMTNVELDRRRIRYGFAGESIGSIISTFFGGFPTTAYAQNVGLLRLTGVGSRYPVMIAAVIFIILGFVPKAGALLALTPDAVIGGIFLPAAASLVFTGISILSRIEKTDANYIIAGLSILLAIALPPYGSGIKGLIGTMLSNSVIVGAVCSIVLHILLISIPNAVMKKKS